MSTTSLASPSLFDVVIREPLDLIKAQPHQLLLSAGSVSIMAQFAATAGIVDPAVGWAIAIGVEWAYLRGLASDAQVQSGWGVALSWSAFIIVVLWGVLWVAQRFGAIPPHPGGTLGWGMAVAHILPIAWLSLCAAMCHRAAQVAHMEQAQLDAADQRAEEKARAAEQESWNRAQAEKDRELERWKEAQRLKAELRAAEQVVPVQSGVRASRSQSPTKASGRGGTLTPEQMREHIVRTLTEQPKTNKVALSRELNIGRTTLYEIIADARKRGELP